MVAVDYFKFLSSSFQLCPLGDHYGLALEAAQSQGTKPSSPSLAAASRRDIIETKSKVGTIRYNFLILNSNLIYAHSQEWIQPHWY